VGAGDDRVHAEVEATHHDAVANTIAWLEANTASTRIGAGGTLQVETRGLVAAAFDHREPRAGDPDLHTHVAVANKVRAVTDHSEGSPRWLALDGRALYTVAVAASERYNTRVEDGVRRRLGVTFAARADTVRRDARPRPRGGRHAKQEVHVEAKVTKWDEMAKDADDDPVVSVVWSRETSPTTMTSPMSSSPLRCDGR
jgi:hypothetical protein